MKSVIVSFCSKIPLIYAGMILLGIVIASISSQPKETLAFASVSEGSVSSADAFYSEQYVQSVEGVPEVHAGTLTVLPNGKLMSAWFGGSREGAQDVCIFSSVQEPGSGWSEPKVIASREQTTNDLDLYIRKLGNPILKTDSRGRVWLYYVTVSFGGWSASSITCRYSDDNGETWSAARKLICNPFLNISTLVKGQPLETQSGHLLIPVYHELLNKFAELLVINPDGELVDKYRLNSDGGALQPNVLPINEHQALVLCRQSGHSEERTLLNEFDLASGSRTPVTSTTIRNPGSAVSVVKRPTGGLLMACNPGEGRERLSLAVSKAGKQWKELVSVEDGSKGESYSYPFLINGRQAGVYHMIYTWQRKKMKVVTFNEAWLKEHH